MPPLIEMRVTIIGAEQFLTRLRDGTSIPARVRATVRRLAYELEAKVKTQKLNGQVLHRRSGRLARSINTRFTSSADSETASVGTNVFYGRIWEWTGSRAYTIMPTKKKALYWPGAAHPVHSVFHPAQAPRPFLRPALDEMRPKFREQLALAMRGLGTNGGSSGEG